ncbi:MAG: flagellin [Pseudomonadota bacterium]
MTEILPDIAANTRLSRAIGLLKRDADTTRTEVVTGRFEDVTRAVDGDVGTVHLLQKSRDDARAFQQRLTLAESRIDRTQAILDGVADSAGGIGARTLAANTLDQTAGLEALSAESTSTLEGLFSSLNGVFAGRAVFGGDDASRSPLADVDTLLGDVRTLIENATDPADLEAALDTYFNDPAGGFETTIYVGGVGDAPGVEIAPGVLIDADIKANAQPLKELMRGFAVMANLDVIAEEDRDAIAAAAGGTLINGEQELTALRATVGVDQRRISESKARFENEEQVLDNIITDRIGRDSFEAATRLQLLETQLETSYLITGRIARLTLAQFL